MKTRFMPRLAAAMCMAGACLAVLPAQASTVVAGGRYGPVSVTMSKQPMRGFVVLFSAGRGWTGADQQAADALAQSGAVVVGVDTERYAANLGATKETCHHLVGDAEAVSHQIERQQASSRYFSPIVAGTGQGAVLAEHILAQAPDNTVAGAVSLDAQRNLDARFQPCPPDPTITHSKGLPGFFAVGVTAGTPAPDLPQATQPLRRFPAGTAKSAGLLALTAPYLRRPVSDEEDVSDLPLIELPAAHPTDLLAVVISGDGGWRDLDKTIAELLQKDGVAVVGLDSLRYFWSEKTPAQTSHDLARVLRTYSARWHTKHIALIGYSFGADVMPFAYNRLPEALRAQVSLVALLGFAPAADFQIRVTGWLGMPASDKALRAAPEVAKLPPAIVQCIYGEHEEDTLCPALAHTGVDVIRTAGEHHFGRDYGALEQRILAGWKKQIALRGQPSSNELTTRAAGAALGPVHREPAGARRPAAGA